VESSVKNNICRVLGLLLALTTRAVAGDEAAPATPPPPPATPYSGDLWTRSTLTGDWDGARNQLAAKGFTADLTLVQVLQGVVDSWEYSGRYDLVLNFDTGKMGLWQGGFFILEAEGQYGDFIGAGSTGALLPVNTNSLFPLPGEDCINLSGVTYMQFLSEKFGFMLGKLTTITETSGDMNEFAHGKGAFRFLNTSFNFNPIMALTVPYSTLGGGVIFMPTKELVTTFAVVDPSGASNTSGLSDAFSDGASFAGEARLTTSFFGKTGHQLIGGTYSTKDYTALNQPPRNLIIPDLPVGTHSGSWSIYYNFDQYIVQDDPKVDRGWGVFGRLGTSDGDANPIDWFASIGVGGKGVIPGRPNDRFGIGYYYMWIANQELPNRLNFEDSQGFEAFYEVAITPYILFTPDVQVIDPSQTSVDTAVVLGARLTMKF